MFDNDDASFSASGGSFWPEWSRVLVSTSPGPNATIIYKGADDGETTPDISNKILEIIGEERIIDEISTHDELERVLNDLQGDGDGNVKVDPCGIYASIERNIRKRAEKVLEMSNKSSPAKDNILHDLQMDEIRKHLLANDLDQNPEIVIAQSLRKLFKGF